MAAQERSRRQAPSTALAHLRICDLGGILAGAGATKLLAAFGAQVVRVEDPVRKGRWDILRGAPPFIDDRRGINLGGGFNNHNVEKLGITLNLRTEEGRALLRRLVAISDVVTENFAAGVLARLGFSYDDLVALRPDVIYVSNCGFGHDGPYRRYKTWGPIVQACCGLTASSGLPDQPPAGWGYSYMDHMGANFMAIAILASLVHRNRTGEGQWIDMSTVEAGANLLGPAVLDVTANGRATRRPGQPHSNRSEHPRMAPHGIYPARGTDEWVAIACRDDDDWVRLGKAVDEPWVRSERFAALADRVDAQDELDDLVAAWTAARTRDETVAALRGVGVPVSIVARPEDRIEHDPGTSEWGLWPESRHSEMGDVRVDGIPVHLSDTDWVIDRGAPCLGEDNDFVLGELLGCDDDEIEHYRTEGVI